MLINSIAFQKVGCSPAVCLRSNSGHRLHWDSHTHRCNFGSVSHWPKVKFPGCSFSLFAGSPGCKTAVGPRFFNRHANFTLSKLCWSPTAQPPSQSSHISQAGTQACCRHSHPAGHCWTYWSPTLLFYRVTNISLSIYFLSSCELAFFLFTDEFILNQK